MADSSVFSPNFSKTKSISATSTSASATLDATDVSTTTANAGTIGGNSVMRVVNGGTKTAFIRFGVGAQTALTTDMPVLAGTIELFKKSYDANTVAAICAGSDSTTIYVTCGEGF